MLGLVSAEDPSKHLDQTLPRSLPQREANAQRDGKSAPKKLPSFPGSCFPGAQREVPVLHSAALAAPCHFLVTGHLLSFMDWGESCHCGSLGHIMPLGMNAGDGFKSQLCH